MVLRKMIATSELAAGEQLMEAATAEGFDMSRGPVRMAFRMFE